MQGLFLDGNDCPYDADFRPGVDANWQRTVKGIVLLVAVIFDVISKKRKKVA